MGNARAVVVCIAGGALFACTAIVAFTSRANAQLVQTECKTYSRQANASLPTEIASYFSDSEKDVVDAVDQQLFKQFAVTRCKRQYGRTLYFLEYPVQRDNGVCHFKHSNISHLFDESGKYLAEKAPQIGFKEHPLEMMIESGAPCPVQDFAGYVLTSSLPSGVFHSIMMFWNKAASSEAELNRAFPALPRDQRVPPEVDKFRNADFEKFRSVLRSHIGKPLPVMSVGLSVNIRPEDTTHYEIMVTDPENANRSWIVGVDLTDKGWVFVDFSTRIA